MTEVVFVFYDNFIKACTMRGDSPSIVAERIGLNRSSVTGWKNGATPKDSTIQKLADYFGISKTDLTGETYLKVTGPVTSIPASSELQRLSDALAELNEEGREKLLDYAADLVASGRYKKADPADLGQKA